MVLMDITILKSLKDYVHHLEKATTVNDEITLNPAHNSHGCQSIQYTENYMFKSALFYWLLLLSEDLLSCIFLVFGGCTDCRKCCYCCCYEYALMYDLKLSGCMIERDVGLWLGNAKSGAFMELDVWM